MPVPATGPSVPSPAAVARGQARGTGVNHVARAAISNAGGYPPNNGPQMPPPPPPNAPTAPKALLQAPVWNPSMGPSPSIMPANGQKFPGNQVPAAMSGMSQAQPTTANQVCKTYNRDPTFFKLGEIISLPYHAPNTNPALHPTDDRLRLTKQGPVFTKRRMAVILWIHRRDMFVLPLYSFEGNGLKSKSRFIQPEYVALQNFDDKNFQPQGTYQALVASYIKKPFHPDTCVHLTGGMKVACIEDIAFCGRVLEESFNRLVKLWEKEMKEARKQKYHT